MALFVSFRYRLSQKLPIQKLSSGGDDLLTEEIGMKGVPSCHHRYAIVTPRTRLDITNVD